MPIFTMRVPAQTIEEMYAFLNDFTGCDIKPDVELCYIDDKFVISYAVCRLENVHNRGVVGSSCDACEIKKATGKYPGEDFNPMEG